MRPDNLLMVADSEHDANMLYAAGLFVHDPFIYLRLRGRCHLVLNDLETARARRAAPHCRILSLGRYQNKLRQQNIRAAGFGPVIRLLLREHRLKKVQVPENFPYGLARELRRLKIKVKVKPGNFFPERAFKTADEVKKISAALIMAEVGLAEGLLALKNSRIGRSRRLLYHQVPLTAEKLRGIIDTAVLQAGGLPNHTIVAGGRQACDPHEPGHGILRAHEPIILDVFPRSQKTGYYGDITRTVVKGRASEAVRRLYYTVARGLDVAFDKIHHKVPTAEVHQVVQNWFLEAGFKTCKRPGHLQGFIHGTGHGLGLELHEAPRINTDAQGLLLAGHVVTIEPGLYYPDMGAVRLEDVALVTTNGPRNLTKFEKVLET